MAIQIPIPQAALTRVRNQTPACSDLQSCQAEVILTCSDFATTAAYLIALPGNEYYFSINDVDNILPYTVVRFNIFDTPQNPLLWLPYAANLWLTAADTTPPLAAARLAGQINQFARQMVQWGYPAFKSMSAKATAISPFLTLYAPWGMLGTLTFATDGPLGVGGVSAGNVGVDHPLWFSLLGPRRHCMRVIPTYPGPYYGDPIG